MLVDDECRMPDASSVKAEVQGRSRPGQRPGKRGTRSQSLGQSDRFVMVRYLAEAKLLPTGSRVVASGAFDDSPQNLANPDPSATVRWGDQSWMEMFIGFMDITQ